MKQADLALKVGYSENNLKHLENSDLKFVNINLLKAVIKELDIEDRINVNDDYIEFLLNNPSQIIYEFRQKKNLTRKQFADMVGTWTISVRDWEADKHIISRAKFEQLKRCMS